MSEIVEIATPTSIPTSSAKKGGIDYGKALTWYVNDKKFWPTVLTLSLYILSCILIIPIFYVGPFLIGYIIKATRNIQQGNYEVPDLEGECWRDGVVLLLISFALTFVIGFLFAIVMFGSTVLGSVVGGTSSVGSSMIGIVTQLMSMVFQLIASLVFPLIYFMAYAIFAKTGSTSSMFSIDNYKLIWEQNTWSIVISYVIYTAAVSALSMVGFLACCVGILPAMVVSNYIMAGFVGQLSVDGVE